MPAPIGWPVLSSMSFRPMADLPTLCPVRPIRKTRFHRVMPSEMSAPTTMRSDAHRRHLAVAAGP